MNTRRDMRTMEAFRRARYPHARRARRSPVDMFADMLWCLAYRWKR